MTSALKLAPAPDHKAEMTMIDQSAIRRSRNFRIVNAVFWFVVLAAVIIWTEAWGQWGAMILEACVPLLFGCYIHLVLRPGGSGGE